MAGNDDFNQILKEVTKIHNSSKYLRENIEKMRADIETTLNNIEKNLTVILRKQIVLIIYIIDVLDLTLQFGMVQIIFNQMMND